jgi:Uma2 family endonuclease
MIIEARYASPTDTFYPESDGQPMAENTRQFECITTIKGGLDAVFLDEPNVFVAGDLLWYPVEGNNLIRTAPDVMVAFGRPKGFRGSYQQWLEGGIPPKVTFEVLSPGNRAGEMIRKYQFYECYGVDEYYIYDPDYERLDGWTRKDGKFQAILEMDGWTSPALHVRFQFVEGKMQIVGPDGRAFASYVELAQERDKERERADRERERADRERQRADLLVEQLKAIGIKPEA